MRLLQVSSCFLLFPFLVAMWRATARGGGGGDRFVRATTGALFVSSVVNHSRPHDGPVHDEIDHVDKMVVAANVLAGCADALRPDVSDETVLVLGASALVVVVGYAVAFNGKNHPRLGAHAEWIHAVCVHGVGAIALTTLSL